MKKTILAISTPSHWNSEDDKELVNKLDELIELKSENGIELQIKEVKKRGARIQIESSGYNLAGFVYCKSKFFSVLKKVKCRHLEDIVYRLQLTYHEIVDILDVKCIAGSTNG